MPGFSYTKIASIALGSTLFYTDRPAASGRIYDYSVIRFVRNGGAYTRGEWAARRTVTPT